MFTSLGYLVIMVPSGNTLTPLKKFNGCQQDVEGWRFFTIEFFFRFFDLILFIHFLAYLILTDESQSFQLILTIRQTQLIFWDWETNRGYYGWVTWSQPFPNKWLFFELNLIVPIAKTYQVCWSDKLSRNPTENNTMWKGDWMLRCWFLKIKRTKSRRGCHLIS